MRPAELRRGLKIGVLVALAASCGEGLQSPDGRLTLSPGGPLVLEAVGDRVALSAEITGLPRWAVDTPEITFASTDQTVAQVSQAGVILAVGNGTAQVTARDASGLADSLLVTVAQAVHSVAAIWGDTSAVISTDQGTPLPLACLALDRNGHPVAGVIPTPTSATGRVQGPDCESLTVLGSGLDTLTVTAGNASIVLPFAIALTPLVSSATGEFVSLDSFPFDYRLWAPSARTNSVGEIEIYVTGYEYVLDSNGVGPGALHRLVSNDGSSFRYDGIAVPLPSPCDLICTGVENVAIVPRLDGPGWRMYLAAGSSGTYGWQVFSATSADERTWSMEPGIRVSNGGPVPPAPPATPPWPVGEGMVIDQLPGGAWRMLVGGYEPVPVSANKFQVVEYQSPDQMTWAYQGTRLTTDQLPATAQRSVYSPTLVEFVPGLWRMFVTADDLNIVGGRSRIFSAVSTDRIAWQFETELLGGVGTNLYYSALVNDRLYFLRQDAGQLRQLAFVTLAMP